MSPSPDAPDSPAPPPPPRRTAEHARLEFMVGEWTTSEEYPPAPWNPKGGSGEGSASISWKAGRMLLVSEYQTRWSDGGRLEGHGLITWNPASGAFEGHWFDTMVPTGLHGEGHFEGESLVLIYRHKTPQGEQEIRSVASPVSDQEFRMVGSSRMGGGDWVEAVRITYKRR